MAIASFCETITSSCVCREVESFNHDPMALYAPASVQFPFIIFTCTPTGLVSYSPAIRCWLRWTRPDLASGEWSLPWAVTQPLVCLECVQSLRGPKLRRRWGPCKRGADRRDTRPPDSSPPKQCQLPPQL